MQAKLSIIYSYIFAKNPASRYEILNFAETESRSKTNFLTFRFIWGEGEGWKSGTNVCGASWDVACSSRSDGGVGAGNNPYPTPLWCSPPHLLQRRPHNLNARFGGYDKVDRILLGKEKGAYTCTS